jgi:hypothetical protein
MKRVPLRSVSVRLAGQAADAPPADFLYAEAIVGIFNSAAIERGMTLLEVQRSLRVLDPIQKAMVSGAPHVDLEDADWQHLNATVQGYRGWRLVHEVVQQFADDISKAESPEDV